MSKRIGLIVAISIAAGVAGCASTPEITTRTVIVAGVGPVAVERLNVRVVSIDRPGRSVIVEQRGHTWLVDVPPVFGNLETIREGDMVDISRVEGVVAEVRPNRRGAKPGITYTEVAQAGTFQNLPERFVARSVKLTARFERFDAASGVVSYDGPLGPRSLTVADPAVRARLQKFKRGDMVDLSFEEAFYITLR
jgi:ribosomal protein L21E